VLRYTALFRAFSPYPDPSFLTDGSKRPYYTPGGPEGEAGNQYFFIDNSSSGLSDSLGQGPFESESVFNFYLPDYQPPGPITNYVASRRVIDEKLVSPEFQILSPVTAIRTMNQVRGITFDSDFDIGNQWEVDKETSLDVNLKLDQYYEDGGVLGRAGSEPSTTEIRKLIESLDMKLCAGTMNASTKEVLVGALQREIDRSNIDTTREKEDLVQAIVSALVLAPDFAVMP
jgi:hypothetical protein